MAALWSAALYNTGYPQPDAGNGLQSEQAFASGTMESSYLRIAIAPDTFPSDNVDDKEDER